MENDSFLEKKMYDFDVDQGGLDLDEENFFSDDIKNEENANCIILSHYNNKSSVLCPKTVDISSQFLALQQLESHQHMIARAKGCVDMTSPKSLQSFLSVRDRKKKRMWKQSAKELNSRLLSASNVYNDQQNSSNSSKTYNNYIEEDDENNSSKSSLNKGNQTELLSSTSKIADKISWYLDALNQGELQSHFFMYPDNFAYSDSTSEQRAKKKVIKGDIMEWHKDHFVKPNKPFSPRILADKKSKSKLREMRCYNPPLKIKSNASTHSSDTFESYDEEEEENDAISTEEEKVTESLTKKDDLQATNETFPFQQVSHSNGMSFTSLLNNNSSLLKEQISLLQPNSKGYFNPTSYENFKNEEDKYLNFLSKITEDILRSGVYTDRSIQQTFEFHLQFYQKDEDKDKMQELLGQILENLRITNDESDEILNRHKTLQDLDFISSEQLNTPLHKDNHVKSDASDNPQTKQLETSSYINKKINIKSETLLNKNNFEINHHNEIQPEDT